MDDAVSLAGIAEHPRALAAHRDPGAGIAEAGPREDAAVPVEEEPVGELRSADERVERGPARAAATERFRSGGLGSGDGAREARV